MKQILIVEDDAALGQGLAKALSGGDRQVVWADSVGAAREQMMCGMPELVMLDVNLPDGSGLSLLSAIKEMSADTRVILLTANDTDADIVTGLELGADDYITKPFSLAVLRARVNTQLRRNTEDDSERFVLNGGYVFDFQRMEFTRDGERIELSKTEQKLLRLLVAHRENILPRGTLVDRIWTDGAEYVDENALSVAIKRLRDKLHAADYIRTVYGIGYVWRENDG